MSNGTFIAVEGLDGAGKTTVVEALAEQFDDAVTTSEPSEFWTGEQLRKSLRSDTPSFVDFFLFMADRHLHIEELIKPEVEAGNVVISDRFADSTRVYQPYQLSDEFDKEKFEDPLIAPEVWIEDVMRPWNYPPDIVVYIQISVETALERADQEEKYENREMLTHVKQNYETLVSSRSRKDVYPEYVVVDGEQPKSDVIRDVVNALEVRLDD